MTWDVVVVGAGIVGAACAERLAHAGLRVAVIDAGMCGGGVTGAGMGHLVAMDGSPAQLTLTRYGRALWRITGRSGVLHAVLRIVGETLQSCPL